MAYKTLTQGQLALRRPFEEFTSYCISKGINPCRGIPETDSSRIIYDRMTREDNRRDRERAARLEAALRRAANADYLFQ